MSKCEKCNNIGVVGCEQRVFPFDSDKLKQMVLQVCDCQEGMKIKELQTDLPKLIVKLAEIDRLVKDIEAIKKQYEDQAAYRER